MRSLRLKIDPRIESSLTHLMSRTNNGEKFFGRVELAKMRSLLRQVADYCGLELRTHALMPNHPHVLVFNPVWKQDPDDEELLRRYRVLNPGSETKYRSKRLDVIAAHLKANTEEGIEWRRKQLAQMGDLSQLMKIFKQRFTAWFNKRHGRTGTIWGGRFKSVLVEGRAEALLAVSGYIDLNPVRAGLVRDPKDYGFSGYAEAVAGNRLAQQGIMRTLDLPTWDLAQAEYRKVLYSIGAKPRAKGRVMSLEDLDDVTAKDGKLTLAETLRCRIRQFSDSVVFGTTEFVAKQLAGFQKANRRKRPGRPRPLPPVTDWGGLATMRGLRRP